MEKTLAIGSPPVGGVMPLQPHPAEAHGYPQKNTRPSEGETVEQKRLACLTILLKADITKYTKTFNNGLQTKTNADILIRQR